MRDLIVKISGVNFFILDFTNGDAYYEYWFLDYDGFISYGNRFIQKKV